MSNINLTCDVCGRSVQGITFVNGMRFCAKCYQETFGNNYSQVDIMNAQVHQYLRQENEQLEQENEQLKKEIETVKRRTNIDKRQLLTKLFNQFYYHKNSILSCYSDSYIAGYEECFKDIENFLEKEISND